MFRNLLYRLKRAIQNNQVLYPLVYNLVSCNWRYFRQQLQISQYPSRFGGMWTDRLDFAEVVEQKTPQLPDSVSRAQLEQWREEGFATLPGLFSDAQLDAYFADIERLKAQQPSPLLVTSISFNDPVSYTPEVAGTAYSLRTVDDYVHSQASRELLFDQRIMEFLSVVFEASPVLHQSLNFEVGSQQAVHQDTAFVRLNAPMLLAAIWIALEDVVPGSGELCYYPGSHRWEGFLFSGRYKHYDEERDGPEQLQQWYQWLSDEAEKRGTELRSFLPRRGDVFIWHAGLAHGGAPVTLPEATRHSLVAHYCPRGVRPLYHYYKPGQRQLYPYRQYAYTSSYY